MSAIQEWFGIYNMLFRHMKETFGDSELHQYIEYIGDTAYEDVSADFVENGIERVSERYTGNFIKDGGAAEATLNGGVLEIAVDACPAYNYMLSSTNPFDKPEQYYCECCSKLNSRVLENAGYKLDISYTGNNGRCKWTIMKGAVEGL